jgi:hypothetical protein
VLLSYYFTQVFEKTTTKATIFFLREAKSSFEVSLTGGKNALAGGPKTDGRVSERIA